MTPNDRRLWIDLTAARYLAAVEGSDFDEQQELWDLAAADVELEAAFHEIHVGLLEEEHATMTVAVADVAAKHLASGEVIRPAGTPVTVADVAEELFRHTPDRLPAAAHALNEKLRRATDELPAELGLSKLVAWAEARFGTADPVYWRAFYDALVKLDLRSSAETEYQLAARSRRKSEGQS